MVSKKSLALFAVAILSLGFFYNFPAVKINTDDQTFLFGHPIDKPQCQGEGAVFGCHCAVQISLSYWFLLTRAPLMVEGILRLETLLWLPVVFLLPSALILYYVWPFTPIGYYEFMGCP